MQTIRQLSLIFFVCLFISGIAGLLAAFFLHHIQRVNSFETACIAQGGDRIVYYSSRWVGCVKFLDGQVVEIYIPKDTYER